MSKEQTTQEFEEELTKQFEAFFNDYLLVQLCNCSKENNNVMFETLTSNFIKAVGSTYSLIVTFSAESEEEKENKIATIVVDTLKAMSDYQAQLDERK